ncbi:hypothetical protein L3C95_30295 [Chitinophaga filiformis]|uniref:hypothetical protein n=1 Tax=Chitinophaga filiformis TaxID=104663 RepID=UPI001F253F2B|nr:hypothetical protein [Chitinophaga filiformis]MCF6407224.1 hypothetical protein [Chitinophaga filiformis]
MTVMAVVEVVAEVAAAVDVVAGVVADAEDAEVKNRIMKQKNVVPMFKTGYLPGVAGYLLLPCIFGGLFLASWFPYHLAGKQFLAWYLVHIITGHLLLYLAGLYSSVKLDRLSLILLWITVLISLSRICQGLYHHKPILYLCVLTVLNVLLLRLWSRKN